jgi:hypothetical protein
VAVELKLLGGGVNRIKQRLLWMYAASQIHVTSVELEASVK